MIVITIPYQLQFKYPFRIAHGVRTHTDVVYVKLEHDGFVGWGEATLPPYLPETQKTVIEFVLEFAKSVSFSDDINDWFTALNAVQSNMSAKAALDMALWSLKANLEEKTIGELLGITAGGFPLGTYTIGVCPKEEMQVKITEAIAAGFELFKLKLNGVDDERVIIDFKSLTDKPFAVDVNQGWADTFIARNKVEWLASEGCLLVEQPLPKNRNTEMTAIKNGCPLSLYADESCQRLADIEPLSEYFDGINIKLMKCGGITEALQMINKARELDMKILIGCMSESSVGCTAAAHLTPLADYADLDGPYLIANDPFTGIRIRNGRVVVNELKQVTTL